MDVNLVFEAALVIALVALLIEGVHMLRNHVLRVRASVPASEEDLPPLFAAPPTIAPEPAPGMALAREAPAPGPAAPVPGPTLEAPLAAPVPLATPVPPAMPMPATIPMPAVTPIPAIVPVPAAMPAPAAAPPAAPPHIAPPLAIPAPPPPEPRPVPVAAPAAPPAPEPEAGPAPEAKPEPAPAPAAAPGEAGPIVIEGRTVSPAQYRWLFPDLAGLSEKDEVLTAHYLNHGRQEIASRNRFAPQDALLAVELQQLSPVAPRARPSPFWRYLPGTSGTLNIICSHIAPAGEFGPTIPQRGSPDAQLYIKAEAHEFFQRGIPGLTGTIEETARWLEAVIARTRPTRLRVVGFSAGAYGALLFGHLLSADAVTAIAGDFVLGRPQYRSSLWYPARLYHPVYRDLRPFLPAMAGRLALLYPAYDPMEFRAIQEAREAGLGNIAMAADFEPAENGVNMGAILAGPEALVPLERINPRPYTDPFDDATVEQLATAHEALAEQDYARSLALLRAVRAVHPRNHGLLCHIGIQEALTGDPDGGERSIGAAREALIAEFPDGYGERVSRFARSLVRNFYRPEPTLLRRLEAAFDPPPVSAGS